MINAIISIGIVIGAMVFAWFFTRSSSKRRAEESQARERQTGLDLAQGSGRPADVPSLCGSELESSGCLAMQVLDDDLAHNSKHVTNSFRKEYDRVFRETGGDMARAFYHAMNVSRWRAGSRGQVYDRLFSHRVIDEATRNAWTRETLEKHQHGYGVMT